MKTRTKWAWINWWGSVMSVHDKKKLAVADAIARGWLPPGYDKIEMTPRARWRIMQEHGNRVVRLRGCLR